MSIEQPSDDELRPGHRPLPANVRLLGLASLLNDIASELAFPLLPDFIRTVLGGTDFAVGILEGMSETTASIVKLFAGSLSDRLRKRRGFVIFGYALAAVARPLMGLAAAPWQVVAARTADRFGKGIRSSPRDALITDSTPADMRGRAFGFNQAMDHVGAAIGPLLALAYLAYWPGAYRSLFALTVVPGAIVVALLAWRLKERPIATSAGKPFRFSLAPFDRRFRWYLLSLVIFTLGNSSDMFLLIRAEELGVSPAALWCGFHVVKAVGNLLAGPAVDRLGPRPLILVGWIIYGVIYLGFAWAQAAWHVWALMLGYSLFYALTEPAEKALVANLAPPSERGLAFGWFSFAIGIAALPANLIFGALYQWVGAAAAFGWGAALALAAALTLAMLRQGPPARARDLRYEPDE